MRCRGLNAILAFIALAISWNPARGFSLPRIEAREFGKLPDGSAVKLFTLRNTNGLSAKVMTYGASCKRRIGTAWPRMWSWALPRSISI